MVPADSRHRKRLAVRPLVILVVAVLVLNAAGWAVDLSPLRQEDESWGYAFGAFFLGVYAVPVVVVAAVCALLTLTDDARTIAVCAWIGSIASAVAGAVLGVLAVPDARWVARGHRLRPGLALAVAVALLSPLATCLRRSPAVGGRRYTTSRL